MEQVDVSINEYTRKDFFDDVFLKHPDLEQAILQDFKHYKETGEVPDYFGRDVAYTQPEAAYKSCMMHIHLCFPPDSFPTNRVQYYRTCKSNSPENDACLVYVQGLLEENKYSLLAIMHPDAHGKARNPKIMSYLARIAQNFRDNN
ncbi:MULTISPECIES: type II toxin-antitoxin system YafO family toxin [Photorhabdus]|uniref:Toxin YafO n=1 Tax=Photorhabdus bodei TaxID=2029681 RepID=A0A329XAE1_9GAMM|nr:MULTISPECIES: type II toxin-antitoxin system YafO family toxin [Photorhabdus]EQC00044.1 hypothetical protein B738_13193 [Photorhabdus temperata subsp. temperata M1021]NDK98630.1 hypothetical protein [Photorhabdus bodei]NDL02883.1 hypothetical protein [Photorhabdus bodei]NDL07088.1 hypothetical protein [Photorhabdus bodei]RAX13807.1 hypothetical protein CKY02_05030 [Photorhabdus bodei]